MGKVSSGWIGGRDEDDADEKRRNLRRELDQVRKNALGRKRDLRKDSIIHKPKSGLMRTLNQFASQRRKIEDATQITNLLNKPRIIKQDVIQPRDLRGFFAAGIKGREITRPDPVYEKYKKAVLQNDPLQLLQSNTLHHRPEERPHKSTKSPIEDDHAELKMEVSKILNNFHSSGSSSFDLDEPGIIEFPSSPVIGRHKGAKKKVNQVRTVVNEEHRNYPREKEVPIVNNVKKEERYRRQLFDANIVGVNNKHNEVVNNVMHNHGATRKSTPENMIFYSEVVSKELVNNNNKKKSKIDHLCADSDVITYYVKICKFFCQKELKNMFRDKYQDPEEKAKEALKLTYKRSLKEYFDHQNCQTKSVDHQTTPSSNTEILLEPDSAIARVVKKNVAFLKQKQSSASNSTDSTKNFVSKVDAQIHNSSTVNSVENNIAKRKRVPSSKGSELQVPLSTQAIADPKSVRADSKMNMIHPYRQEIVARFLEDQKSFNCKASQEIPERHVCKEKLYISNDFDGTFLMQKSTKYIPAILRRNRSLAACIEEEKAILSIEKCPSQRNHNSSMLEIDLDNIENEHTPNTVIEPLLEAPKCKYAHANAKYNQPFRTNIPMDSRHQKKPVAERHSHRAPSPDKGFSLSQPYRLSPIKQYSSYADAGRERHHFQPSQESQLSDSANCMSRTVSFGDIQDRTNRLTICSQNQACSQESTDHAYASQRSCHYQACEPTSGCCQQNQPRRVAFAEPAYCDRASRAAATYVPQSEYCSCGCCRQEAARQPIKFHAAEGSRRQPIYEPGESSCSYARKQPCCPSDSSDFEYLDVLKMSCGPGGDRPQSFVAPPNASQRYVVQRQLPASPPPPAVCQQLAHRHGHRAANEACKMNEAILHHINRQMYSKRQ